MSLITNLKMRSKIFEIMSSSQTGVEKYESILEAMDNFEEQTMGKENAKFYDTLRLLSNSINNAGWEDRHSEHISFIQNKKDEIEAEYDKYLPQ